MNHIRTWTIVFTVAFLAVLAANAYPGLRGGAGWQWPYASPENWAGAGLLALLLILYVLSVLRIPWERLPRWMGLGWPVLAGAGLALAVVAVRGDVSFLLFTRTVSPVQTGASTLAVRTLALEGPGPALSRWPQVMDEALDANLIHFTTSPPGQPLAHYALAQVLDAVPPFSTPLSMALRPFQCSNDQVMAYTRGELSSVFFIGMLMPLWAALAVLPIYGAARQLGADPAAALHLIHWWPLVPTVLLFAPTWNTLYPLLGAASFVLLLAALRAESTGRQALLAGGAGLVMSVTTFLNFAVLPLLLLFGLYTLGWWFFMRSSAGGLLWPVRVGAWFGLGLSLVWLIYGLASGVSPLAILQTTFGAHGQLVQREYLPWLLLHPYDTLMFMGWPLTALAAVGAGISLRHLSKWAALNPAHVLALALLVTLLMVNLAGVAQGENARILSFYAPFLLLAGASILVQQRGWDRPLLVAQALSVLVMAAVLPVVPLDLNPQPRGPRDDFPLMDQLEPRSVDAVFSSEIYRGTFRLESYRFVADPAQQVLTLELIWQGGTQVERPYQFEAIARAESSAGLISSEPVRWYAQFGHYLLTCWRSGERVHDLVQISLPPVPEPVVWSLELRAVDERTRDVMRAVMPNQPAADAITLGPVPYP